MSCTLCGGKVNEGFEMCDGCYFSVTRINRKTGRVEVEDTISIQTVEISNVSPSVDICGCSGNCSDLSISPHNKKRGKKKSKLDIREHVTQEGMKY
jgi:hypothetical protein